MVAYGRMWPHMDAHGCTWLHMAAYCRIWPHIDAYGCIWPRLAPLLQICRDDLFWRVPVAACNICKKLTPTAYGRICLHVDAYGRIWLRIIAYGHTWPHIAQLLRLCRNDRSGCVPAAGCKNFKKLKRMAAYGGIWAHMAACGRI